jgi:hypothetical protein
LHHLSEGHLNDREVEKHQTNKMSLQDVVSATNEQNEALPLWRELCDFCEVTPPLTAQAPSRISSTAGLALKLNPLTNSVFKLRLHACFYSGGKSRMLKLLGFTRFRALALPLIATWAPGVRKAVEY